MEYPFFEMLMKFNGLHGDQVHKNRPENTKAAVCLEGTCRWHFPMIMKLFSYYLGPDWNLYLFHTPYNHKYVFDVLPNWDIKTFVIQTPKLNAQVYNEIVRTPQFWANFPETTILNFEPDAILCQPWDTKWERWDMIGAPCGTDTYNGGLRLTKRDLMIRAATKYQGILIDEQEDVFFTKAARLLDAKLPDMYQAALFSVESNYYAHPQGMHGIDKAFIPPTVGEKITAEMRF